VLLRQPRGIGLQAGDALERDGGKDAIRERFPGHGLRRGGGIRSNRGLEAYRRAPEGGGTRPVVGARRQRKAQRHDHDSVSVHSNPRPQATSRSLPYGPRVRALAGMLTITIPPLQRLPRPADAETGSRLQTRKNRCLLTETPRCVLRPSIWVSGITHGIKAIKSISQRFFRRLVRPYARRELSRLRYFISRLTPSPRPHSGH
jgi:hypothetical protein